MASGLHGKILKLGIPILIGQLGTIVVGFADTAMVGRYSTESLASASFVNNLFNLILFAALGFSYGITPLAGALYGRGEKGQIGSLLRNALFINLLFGLFLSGVMVTVFFNVHHMGQPEHLLPLIRPYFLIYLAGVIPVVIFNVFSQWSYAINRTRMPMWIILGCNILNIAGNYALIEGHWGFPQMGLNGAGISTLLSRSVSAIAIVSIFCLKKEYSRYRHGFIASKTDSGQMATIGRTSWPVSLQMALESGSFSFAGVMAGWFGDVELASFQVIVILGTLGFCIYYSMGASVSVLVSNACGVGDRKLMRRTAFAGYRIILALATLSSLLFIFAGSYILPLFTSDPRVIAVALSLIVPLVLYQYADATQINFANALRGTSNVIPMIWISLVSYAVIGVPATYILAVTCGLEVYGIILSFSGSLLTAATLFLHYFLRTTAKS